MLAKDDHVYYRYERMRVISNGKWLLYEPTAPSTAHTFWKRLLHYTCSRALASPVYSFKYDPRRMSYADLDSPLPDFERAVAEYHPEAAKTAKPINPACDLRAHIDGSGRLAAFVPGTATGDQLGFDGSFVLPLLHAGFTLRWSSDEVYARAALVYFHDDFVGIVMATRCQLGISTLEQKKG